METNRIICGDNCEVMRTMPSESIDLVVTSPPYDNLRTYGGHPWDFEGVAQELWRLIKPGGVVVWVVNDATVNGSETGTSFRQALRFMEIGFRLHDTMIWERPCPFPESTRYHPNFEFMFVLAKGKLSRFNPIMDRKTTSNGRPVSTPERQPDGRIRTPERDCGSLHREYAPRFNIWRIISGSSNGTEDSFAYRHPAIFPEQLVVDHIKSWSNEKDLVLDIALKVKSLNNNPNIDILLSRDSDKFVKLSERTNLANSANANLFLSIHLNNDASKLGTGIACYVPFKKNLYVKESTLLAKNILAATSNIFTESKLVNTGEKGIYVIENTKMPSVLFECGFISNAKDLKIIQSDEDKIARMILDGVCSYLSNKK
jgi:site-specific DNA-methyltransferase (adenine-specific)